MTSFPAKDAQLRICPLRESQIDQAYASLELIGLPISLGDWRRYACNRINAGPAKAGVLSLQCGRAYFHGLLSYEVVTLGAESRMAIDLFQTVDYVSDSAAGSLMVAAESIAVEQGCVDILLDLPDFKDSTIIALKPRSLAILCQTGYAIDSIQLSKRLAG
jgi:hypothetical protein